MRQGIERALRGVDRSTHVVEQLLTLARLEPEAIIRPLVPIDLVALGQSAVEQFAAQAVEKDISVGFSGRGQIIIMGDEEGLRLMINNLIDNAIRYTAPNGNVDVHVRLENGAPSIEVTDNGVGIPEIERGRIFDRFYRVEGIEPFGTGLGLAIVKTVVDQHDGEITIEDAAGGVGTCFHIRFPKQAE